MPSRSELKARKRVNRYAVGVDASDVAEDDIGSTLAEHRADTVAKPGEVASHDRAADGEGDRSRR